MHRMRVESLRLLSFKENCHLSTQVDLDFSWTHWRPYYDELTPEVLARNGFCYFGLNGLVKCAFCSKRFHPKVDTTLEQLQREHAFKSTYCNFERLDNIPIEKEQPAAGLPITDQVFPNVLQLLPRREYTKKSDLKEMHIYSRSGYFNVDMVNKEVRKETFKTLKKLDNCTDTIDSFASAGFYFIGPGDYIECYQCGLGLFNWKLDSNPFEAHIIFNSNCSHTVLIKGERFVELFKLNIAQRIAGILNRALDNSEYTIVATPAINTEVPGVSGEGKDDCVICCLVERNTIFFPCRHLAVCNNCASNLTKCAVCNMKFTAFTRVYIA